MLQVLGTSCWWSHSDLRGVIEWEAVDSQDGLQVFLLSCRRNWPPTCFYKAYCSALVQQSTTSASFLPPSLFLFLPLPSLLQDALSAWMTSPVPTPSSPWLLRRYSISLEHRARQPSVVLQGQYSVLWE